MRLLKWLYEKKYHQEAPYYYSYSIFKIIGKPIRKWFTNVAAANCPFNCLRILIYRLCGFKIGKGTFIGMRCYLDDMCYELMTIGNNVTISYGVYFACHGKNQGHYPIVIEDDAYIGMRANVISKNACPMDCAFSGGQGVKIGKNAVIGACALVNRDVPADASAVGVPCRIIENINANKW